MEDSGDINKFNVTINADIKKEKIRKYLHHNQIKIT